jgi:hypothetical protein
MALWLKDHRQTLFPPPKLLWSNSVFDYLQHQRPINAQTKATKLTSSASTAVTSAANIANTGACALFMTTLLGEPAYLNIRTAG